MGKYSDILYLKKKINWLWFSFFYYACITWKKRWKSCSRVLCLKRGHCISSPRLGRTTYSDHDLFFFVCVGGIRKPQRFQRRIILRKRTVNDTPSRVLRIYCSKIGIRGTQRHFSENICSEDDLRSRIFGTCVVKFLACLSLLGFSNI